MGQYFQQKWAIENASKSNIIAQFIQPLTEWQPQKFI